MFLERVTALYQAQNISRNKLLSDLGLDKSSFLNWEKRGNIPSGDVVAKIADYFHVSTDYLLGRTGDPRLVDELGKPAPQPGSAPPGYDALSPALRAAVDQLVAALGAEQAERPPVKLSAVAQGGAEHETEPDPGITLPRTSTRVLPAPDTAGTGGTPGAPGAR